ncbi:hypothetical protein [Nocardia nova]|uniref:hypothetical protein n=1 Tax=Nocardia nova TaxID=37330 RepID=UPI0004B55583|nr:hypothetical protein [Nocardia nova]
MIISSNHRSPRLFRTELPCHVWAVWTVTTDAASIRIHRIRHPRNTSPGIWWPDQAPAPLLPQGMIAFPHDDRPSLDHVRAALPTFWHGLWNAIENEFHRHSAHSSAVIPWPERDLS